MHSGAGTDAGSAQVEREPGMKSMRIVVLPALVALFAVAAVGLGTSRDVAQTRAAAAADGASGAAYAKLPLRFERNRGQTDAQVRYVARGPGYTLFLTADEAVFALAGRRSGGRSRRDVVRMRFATGNTATVAGRRLPGVTNYLRGRGAPSVTGVPGYASVKYRNAFRGIDVEYHARRKGLEYDYIVAPGADAGQIALTFDGARSLKVDAGKRLRIATAGGELRQERPVAHQVIGGVKRSVAVDYRLLGEDRVGLRIGDYDRTRKLIIDPVVSYGTMLGGAGGDSIAGVAVDGSGSAYVTGSTTATDFPTANAIQPANAGATDAYVAKLNPGGTALVYATYIGGSGIDRGRAIAVTPGGEAHVTGDTVSANFPTANALQAAMAGVRDTFVTKLNAAGSALVYSTYLGGTAADDGFGIAVDPTGAYVAGQTASANFPTANALQAAMAGVRDAFVTKLNAAGSALVYSTYLGGAAADDGFGVAVDGAGAAYIAGQTASANFPTANAVQPALAGGTQTDAFVTKLNAAGSALAYSTYLGGPGVGGAGPAPTGADGASAIAVSGGQAYVTGQTESAAFPTTAGALQGSLAGEGDAFVTRLSADGTTRLYSTYLGGGSSDQGNAIAVQGGTAYVAGSTSSGDFPLVNPASLRAGNGDAFLSKVSTGGTELEHSSIFGGSNSDSGSAVAADASGGAYLAGQSQNFANGELPTAGGLQPNFGGTGGNTDGFLIKVSDTSAAAPLVTRVLPRSGPASGGARVSIRGSGFTGATQVTFGAATATDVTVVSSMRIDVTAPAGSTGEVHVRVMAGGQLSPANPAARFSYAEGSWELAGEMQQARFAATYTLLPDGKVLAAGGRASQGGAALASAELYDPLTRTWSPTGSMSEDRFTHTATLLPSGKVLVAGGFNAGFTTNAQPNSRTAELYDPATGTWSSAGTMTVRHSLHSAILLRGGACDSATPPSYCGKVLVASGRTCTPQDAPPDAGCNSTFTTNVVELYDPTEGPTGSWTAVAPLNSARTTTDAALLPDGRVLIPAGFPGGQSTAEIYDPATNEWTLTEPLNTGRARGGAVRLLDGRVLVVAGFPNNQTGEVFDPVTETWDTTGQMLGFGRFDQFQALLPNGKVLVAGGGNGGAAAELYNPATNAWESAGQMTIPRGSSSSNANTVPAVVLSASTTGVKFDPAVCGYDCGKVLLAGDTNDRTTELYAQPGLPGPPAVAPP
ncbi:MAG TPA: SBBP repeat-containing protein, partial [Solirubrobacteraceae bacterium]|nr:SBBP repeat-containing protein [Solirubrobacteraceae bacterium]